MSSVGLNIARDGSTPIDTIVGLKATWVRIVAMPDLDLSAYFREMKARGLRILLVLARESGGDFALYQWRYGDLVDAVQVGNEPDLASPSSWTMTPVELTALGKAARAVFPATPLVCAGLASGHPEWLAGADLSWADAIAFHPYLKDAPNPGDLEDLQDVDTLIPGYASYGKPLLITEWGWWSDDEPRATEETRDMTRWAGQTGDIEVFFYFCVSDAMVPPFGLLKANGKEKPRAQAFKQEAAKAIHSLWPVVEREMPDPEAEPSAADPWQFWTAAQAAAATGADLAHVQEHWPRVVDQLQNAGIYDYPTALAAFATVLVEVGTRFEPIPEYATGDAYEGRFDLGNDHVGDGRRYKGRGFIQITGRGNYRYYGQKVAELWGAGDADDLNLEAHPENALQPDVAAAVLAVYFRDRGIPALAKDGNWAGVRRAVNGGMNGWQTFADAVEALKAIPSPGQQPTPLPTPDPSADYALALRTIRDKTIPDIRAQVDELERIVRQFIGDAA